MDVCKACLPYPFLFAFTMLWFLLSFPYCIVHIVSSAVWTGNTPAPTTWQSRQQDQWAPSNATCGFVIPIRAPPSTCSSLWQFWRQGSVFRLSLSFLRGLCKFYYCALGLHISWVLATSLTARGSDSGRVLSQMAARVCFFTSVPTERDAQ